jgi:hypothetical protein
VPIAADTSADADAVQIEAYRRARARLLYGDDLVRRAWPGLELVDP